MIGGRFLSKRDDRGADALIGNNVCDCPFGFLRIVYLIDDSVQHLVIDEVC